MIPGSAIGAGPLDGNPVYEFVRTIGRGQRSLVQVARHRLTGQLVAIKFLPRGWEPNLSKYVAREILNHQELSLSKHPHVVEFKEVFVTQRYLAEVLEYVEGETLQVFLEKVGGKVIEGLARFIFQQLIIALDFCHRKGKVNRDIKLSNILLSIAEGQLPLVKLCDFGFSKDTHRHSEPHSQVGTALFVAPEVMQNFSGGRYDGQAADVWACGVCLFIMLFGRHPYLRPEDSKLNEQQQMIKLFQRMMQNQLEFPPELASTLTPECLDLLGRMLRTNPAERSTMGDIQRHVWFTTALPEGAGLMNDLFLAEETTSLSPQSQSQIEQMVALAAKLDDLPPTRVQLPSVAARMAAGMPPLPQGAGGSAGGGAMLQQHQQHQQQQRQAMSAGGVVPPPRLMQQQQQQAQPQQAASSLSAGMATSSHAVPTSSTAQSGHLLQHRGSVGTPPAPPPSHVGSPAPFPTSSNGMAHSQQPQFSGGGAQGAVAAGGGGYGATSAPHAGGPQQLPPQQAHSGGYGDAHKQQQQQQQHLSPPPLPGLGLAPGQLGFAHAHAHAHVHPAGPPLGSSPGPGGGGGGGSANVNAVLSMIPDLDAMIMSMPETDLLQAATIDLRPFNGMQQQQQQQPSGRLGGPQDAMGPPPARGGAPPPPPPPAAAVGRTYVGGSISSVAPGSVVLPGGRPFAPSAALDGGSGSFLATIPGGPSMIGASGSLAPLVPPPAMGAPPPQPAPPPPQPQQQQGGADATPFLYEGNDDDLPMVGSVSAVRPAFDWGSFNAPMLANNVELQASQQWQASRFTRVCRDVTAKLSEAGGGGGGGGGGRAGTPPAMVGAQGPGGLSDEALQQQMSAMGVGLHGGGPAGGHAAPLPGLHAPGSNGLARMGPQ